MSKSKKKTAKEEQFDRSISYSVENAVDLVKSCKKTKFDEIIKQHSISDKLPALSLSGWIDSYIIMNYFTNFYHLPH